MKRIKTIKDLEVEKLRLRIRQLELEKQMNQSWQQLSSNWSSNGKGKQHPEQSNTEFDTGNRWLNGALNYGAGFLSHKLGLIAGRKIEMTAEQILEKVAARMNSLIERRKRS